MNATIRALYENVYMRHKTPAIATRNYGPPKLDFT